MADDLNSKSTRQTTFYTITSGTLGPALLAEPISDFHILLSYIATLANYKNKFFYRKQINKKKK